MSERFVVYNGVKYAFDLNKIKEFCLKSDKDTTKESEVIENYEVGESTNLVNKTQRTLKTLGNPQNDSILYDMVKMFMTSLLDYDGYMHVGEDIDEEEMSVVQIVEKPLDFGMSLAFNTLLEMGFLYIID